MLVPQKAITQYKSQWITAPIRKAQHICFGELVEYKLIWVTVVQNASSISL